MFRQVSLKGWFILLFIAFVAPIYVALIVVSMRQGWVLNLIAAVGFVILGFAVCISIVKGMNKQNRDLKENAGAASLKIPEALEERDTIAAVGDAIGEGFFFMDKDFVIQKQYSRSLETVLGMRGLNGKKLPNLLAARIQGEEPEISLFLLAEYLNILFNRDLISEQSGREAAETLNPIREIVYLNPETGEERILNSKFVTMCRGSVRLFVLGNIRDVTEDKRFREQVAEESKKNREEIRRLKSFITTGNNAR